MLVNRLFFYLFLLSFLFLFNILSYTLDFHVPCPVMVAGDDGLVCCACIFLYKKKFNFVGKFLCNHLPFFLLYLPHERKKKKNNNCIVHAHADRQTKLDRANCASFGASVGKSRGSSSSSSSTFR